MIWAYIAGGWVIAGIAFAGGWHYGFRVGRDTGAWDGWIAAMREARRELREHIEAVKAER